MTEPRLLFVDNTYRLSVALSRGDGTATVYVSADEPHDPIRPFDVLYNSWEGELYRVVTVDRDDEAAIVHVLNTGEGMETSLEYLEDDADRIISMEEWEADL